MADTFDSNVRQNTILWDPNGNPIATVGDGEPGGAVRLKSTLYSVDGDAISLPSVPSDASGLSNDFVREPGTSPDLLVDGDPTPVVFTYNADATKDISLQSITFVFAASVMRFGSFYFGTKLNGLTNGVLVQITSNSVTGTLINLIRNEDFLSFASPGGFEWIVSSNDLVSSNYVLGGAMKLHAGTADNVKVTVRDDIDSVGTYFQCYVKGNLIG